MFSALRILATTATLLTATAAVIDTPPATAAEFDRHLSRPHVLDNNVGDTVVRVWGSTACSGTPLTGTKFVVTAAHCVLDKHGDIAHPIKVQRDGEVYLPVAIVVNRHYHYSPSPLLDAAIW